jgi:hypothetical protein
VAPAKPKNANKGACQPPKIGRTGPVIIFVSFKPIIEKQSLLRGDRCEAGISKEKSSPINGTFFVVKDLLVLFRCVVWGA